MRLANRKKASSKGGGRSAPDKVSIEVKRIGAGMLGEQGGNSR